MRRLNMSPLEYKLATRSYGPNCATSWVAAASKRESQALRKSVIWNKGGAVVFVPKAVRSC